MPLPLGFTGARLDRADQLRTNADAFAAAMGDPRATCLAMDGIDPVPGERGGLIGLNYCAAFLDPNPDRAAVKSRVSDLVRHAQYIINMGGEDGVGETRGVGIYCDGNVAQSMEDAGFLKQLDSGVGIYGLFEKIAAITGEDVAVQFRY